MATIFDYVKPYPLINPREPMGRTRGGYDASLTAASKWSGGDLVEVNSSGNVQKCTQTTPASVLKLAFAPAPYSIAPLNTTRYGYYTSRGVPLDTMRDGHLVVFTYQGSAADAANYPWTAGDDAAVKQNASREIKYNTAQGVLTIRNTSSTANVILKRVVQGVVGDSNVQVAVEVAKAFRKEL